MISMYKWHQIRVMRDKGAGIKRIARDLRISKNTVRKYLRSPAPPEFKLRTYEKKLDAYREEVNEMLKKGYIGTRVFDEIKEKGYSGSLVTVYRYIEEQRDMEAVKSASTTRFETLPGHQMQYDWKEWMLPVGGQGVKIYLHEVVLGYSRMKHYSFSLSIGSQDVIRAIEVAILFFEGTARELVMDNGKQMVITHRRDGVVHYSDAFLKFCGLYGIEPRACRNYRARTKGKVERPFYYLQEHLLRGLDVSHLDEFDGKLTAFTETYNQRPHSTLGESPQVRFEREKGELKPVVAVEPTVLYPPEPRQVSNDCYIQYRGEYYPVPMRLCLQEVFIECVFGRRLRIYEKNGMLISEQAVRLEGTGQRPEHPEHETINQRYQEKRDGVRSAIVQKFISLFGTTGDLYLSGLRKTVSANLYWHLSEILACCDLYDPSEVKRVLEECLQIGSYHKNSVVKLLDVGKIKRPSQDTLLPYERWHGRDLARPLSAYAGIGKEVGHE